MSSPYRSAGVPDREVVTAEPQPLAVIDVSGARGARGVHGSAGAPGRATGCDGGPGGNAGRASAGEAAGQIRLELQGDDAAGSVTLGGELFTARGERRTIRHSAVIDEAGFIALRAVGGDGGNGGDGGRGGDGARGANGSDATQWSSGSSGGDGGDGGAGGDASNGGDGGDGGQLVVAVSDDDTPLLMLVRHDAQGGAGGAPGSNGGGGAGGAGGSGGSSYSWTTESTERDANGNTSTTTHHHSNSGGSDGRSGSAGRGGRARVSPGAPGADGSFAIQVTSADGTLATYPSRYDLRLVSFAHDSLNRDAVYEPRELIRVFDLEVENVGGMPTPTQDELALGLEPGGWVVPEPGELRCARGLAPGARYKVPGELRFRLADHTPTGPGEPLEVEESIHQRAMLPSVRRAFEHYQDGGAADQGRFVIRYPLRLSAVDSLRSLVAGEAARVRFTITNQSRFALGAGSDGKRVVQVRVATAPDSELGDDHVRLIVDGRSLAPGAGWTHELSVLGPGDTAALELTLTVVDGAPEYRRFAAHVTLALGDLEAPASPRAIQLRGFEVRVARPFQVSDADVLLVVNHRTSRDELAAWDRLGERLAFKAAIWDLSRERHLDLERPLNDGISLAAWFAGKAIVILDNEIDWPGGPTHPHVFLSDDQAVRAAEAGIDIAFVGEATVLPRLLVPGPAAAEQAPAPSRDTAALLEAVRHAPRAQTTLYRTYWFRWWAKPSERWLATQAEKLSRRLGELQPDRRHVVVHRYAPELDGGGAWMNRWKVGTLETARTLDTAAAALVHAAVDEADLHDPSYPASAHATTALLVMFDFAENLERLRRLLARPEITADELAPVVGALVFDLANELAAILSPGWMGDVAGAELRAQLSRLEALASSGLSARYGTPGGDALIGLAGQLVFLGRSQVRWWERVPPWRWMRRGPSAQRSIARHVDRFLAGAFGAHDLVQTRADAHVIAEEQERRHRDERKRAPDRRRWALEQARAPVATTTITSDTELLSTPAERVLAGAAYDALAREKADDAAKRLALIAAAEHQHAALAVTAATALEAQVA